MRERTWEHPRLMLAGKTAVAATLAWLLVQPIGGVADDYPYYAPMGAAAAMSSTVVASLRSTAQGVIAILLGAGLAIAVQVTTFPSPVGIAFVMGVGTLLAGWRRLGDMASWVLFAALFVLILGGDDPWYYIGAYAGLTAAGAGVAVLINLLLPQLPITPVMHAQARLRESLAEGLDELADGLTDDRVVDDQDWDHLQRKLQPDLDQLRTLAEHTREARRANWQADRWTEAADRRYEQARALERLVGSVDEVAALLADQHGGVHGDDERAVELRAAIAHAMQAVATMLRSAEQDATGEDAEEGPTDRAVRAVADLQELVIELASTTADQYLSASAIWVNLQRAVDAWS